MDCNRNDCLHYEVCEEWKTLGNENYINESDGRCDFYKREKIITCKECKHNSYQIAKIRDSEPTRIYCRKHKIHPCIDGFCSDAERRKNDKAKGNEL